MLQPSALASARHGRNSEKSMAVEVGAPMPASRRWRSAILQGVLLAGLLLPAGAALASTAPLPQYEILVAGELDGKAKIAAFYRQRGFRPIWTADTPAARQRIRSLFAALLEAPGHGLPYGERHVDELGRLYEQVEDEAGRARLEVRFTEFFLEFAAAMTAGAGGPESVDRSISRRRPVPSVEALLGGMSGPDPSGFLAGLAPDTENYLQLRKELRRLVRVISEGGWGKRVEAGELGRTSSGDAVIQLRDRLIRMGYLRNSATAEYSDSLFFAVKKFQRDHGLHPSGEAGALTIRAVNVDPGQRLRQVLAALERERWMNFGLGEQHILVNLPDFRASLISEGESIFDTRVIIGKSREELQTPEFSDEMTYLVINPTWMVPRSISTKEILPKLKENPFAEPQLEIFRSEDLGVIDRLSVDFNEFDTDTFPFEMRQPPGPANALGRVKFMFPNRFNVYMHDTPLRALFQREARSFSHGCVRVHRAFDLAHILLGRQNGLPKDMFDSLLSTGNEHQVNLAEPLPVHLTYRTAWISPEGRPNYRNDVYGRDQLLFDRLVETGLNYEILGKN